MAGLEARRQPRSRQHSEPRADSRPARVVSLTEPTPGSPHLLEASCLIRTRLGLIVLSVSSLVAVSLWASAQRRHVIPESPVVLSGSDLGVRVEGRKGSARVGRLVVRIDGHWVEALPAGGVVRVTDKSPVRPEEPA